MSSSETRTIAFTDQIVCTTVQECADDLMVVRAARVSFNKGAESMGDREKGLISFLMKNHHGTPFEHNMFTFLVEAPMFVQREQMRHRIGHSYNEWSGRYSKMDPKFYLPSNVRTQVGKPGAYDFDPISEPERHEFRADIEDHCREAYARYEEALEIGVAREQARYFLPSNTYTKYYWTCNSRSLMHFLSLRNHPDAMWEIAQVAEQAEESLKEAMPVTWDCYNAHGRRAP